MKAEVIGWVATAVGTPIVIVTLCWTLVIFHYHRHYWRSTDLLIAAILSQGVIKQIATFAYTILTLLQILDSNEALCSGIVWLLTSIHILQAGTLATLIFSRLLAVRSPVKYRQAVKRTHIVYHLVSLSILSSCIGVAAVLAEGKQDHGLQEVTNTTTVSNYDGKIHHCTFLPHEMDRRYAILSITLHSLLDLTSTIALIVTLFSWCCLYRRQKSNISVSQPSTMMIGCRGNQKRQLLTSSSDLSAMSDISLTSTARNGSSVTQNGGNIGSDRNGNLEILSAKCTTNESHFMNGLLASNLRYINNGDGKLQPKMTFLPPPPKTTSLDALPTLSCSSGFGSAMKSASDANCFRPNSSSAFHSVFPNTSSQFTNSSIDKSTDTLKSCAVISNYNHTAPKSLTTNGSNYEETYERNYATAGTNGNAEDGCRWTSESSYISTSTSSTNSRAPCLARQPVREEGAVVGHEDLRLSSVISMLVLCYVINHFPVLSLTAVGMFAPWLLPRVWSLPALVLWAGLAEEFLLPILLSLCDRNFTAWVANIYTCRDRRVADLARQHQGLDGKFRVFNTQSLQQPEIQGCSQPQSHHHQHQQQHIQQEPVKFPITNGSLFTSVDGRLPIIHNYRRGKGIRTSGAMPPHNISLGLPGAQTRRNELLQTLINLNTATIENQHSDLFKQRTNFTDESRKRSQNYTEKTCEFQTYLPSEIDTIDKKLTNQTTQNFKQHNGNGNMLLTDFGIGNLNPEQQSSDCEDDLNSEDLNEYNVDDDDDDDDEPIYATLSSRSCCSATTAANDDFEFFQHEDNVVDGTEISLHNTEKRFVCGQQSEEENSGQSLLYRYQRDVVGNGERTHQAYQCADWTVDQNNEVLKLVLPLIESYKNQNDNMELPYHSNGPYNGKNVPHCQTITQNASEILKTVIQNELKNKRCAITKGTNGSVSLSTTSESKRKDSNSSSYQTQSETNSKDLQSSCEQGLEIESQKGAASPGSSCENLNLKLPHVTNVTRKKRVKKQSILAGSLSLNNLDELLLEEEEEDLVVRSRSSRTNPNEKTRSGSQNDPNSSDEREVVFELPVKSESVLSLYRLDLDGDSSGSKPKIIDISTKEANNRRFYKQIPGNRRILGQPTPLTRRLGQQTPPTRRLHRQKKIPVPVLSVESLTTALNRAGVSYLDNGDLCRHGSVPDLKRVFVSDYI